MKTICIHVADGFPILSVTLITEPLRVANRELGREAFRWIVVSETGGQRLASSGIPLDTVPLPEDIAAATILLASYRPEASATKGTLSWLRHLDRRGALMGCVDTGAVVFARAGLLSSRPAAVHSEAIAGLHRQFPKSLFVDRLFDFSPPRFSSAGGVATLDMTLALIAHFSDSRIARRVAEILNYAPATRDLPLARLPKSVATEVRDAIAIMDARLADRPGVAEIAGQLGLPVWKLNRLFRRHMNASPNQFFLQRRLTRARDMLRNTSLPVAEIASACGYPNSEAFSRAYKTQMGVQPSRDRSL